jgi:hypothetical protein
MQLSDPLNSEADESLVGQYHYLKKSGVHIPPGSPMARKFADALERENARHAGKNVTSVVKARLGVGGTGSSSALHEQTRRAGMAAGSPGLLAQDRMMRDSRRIMTGSSVPLGGHAADYDPRRTGNQDYFDAEAQSQIERAQEARAMATSGQERTLKALREFEERRQIARSPLLQQARAAAKSNKPKAVEREVRKILKKAKKAKKAGGFR